MTPLPPSITRLVEAHEALCPYFDTGRAHQAPAALLGEYAEAIQNAPATYWAAVERLEPGTSGPLQAWAQDYIERRDYPEFFAAMAEMNCIHAEEGEGAAATPEHAAFFLKMMRNAPPRYWGEAEAVLSDALPTATHVDNHGQPAYSVQQIADKLGTTTEKLESHIQHMKNTGLMDGHHTGSAHPIH